MTQTQSSDLLPGTLPHGHQRGRDADEEALEAALQDSIQPDFMAQILAAESQRNATPVTNASARPPSPASSSRTDVDMVEDVDTDDLAIQIEHGTGDVTDAESDEGDEDVNASHVLLNFPDYLLTDILDYLDEDSIGNCICSCKRLKHVAKSEAIFETLCRRIFPVQCPRVRAAAQRDRFALRKFPTWFDMFHDRPRVRYNGFYSLKASYFKKPELNMWTDIAPGTILEVVYFRYFSFQRDGTVLYTMTPRLPHEAADLLRQGKKEVFRGHFEVERDDVFVSVPTNHCVVEFRFKIHPNKDGRSRGKNVKLILQEHYSFSNPDRTGWVDHYDTHEEVLFYWRYWNL